MSNFINSMSELVEKTVNGLADRLSQKLNIDKAELLKLIDEVVDDVANKKWDEVEDNSNNDELSVTEGTGEGFITENKPEVKTEVVIKEKTKSSIPSELELEKFSCTDLKALCKANGMKVSGKKSDLVKRLVDGDKKPSPKKKSPAKKVKKQTTVEESIKKGASKVQIRRNNFQNYEHVDTGLIFNPEEQVVIGKQSTNANGESEILELTKDDIEQCNKYKFKYRQPENLNDTNYIKVSELEEDSDGKSENFDDITEQDDLIEDDEDDLGEFYESD